MKPQNTIQHVTDWISYSQTGSKDKSSKKGASQTTNTMSKNNYESDAQSKHTDGRC